MSYERSRMGRVTTERVLREVKREHSGSKKACVKQYSRVKTSEEGEQCAFISYACIRGVDHVAREENNAFKTSIMTDRKAVIKNADMSEDMQQDAVDCATQAMEKYNIEKDIAAYIKKEFDKKYNPTWHCIVGRNFGSYVTHETKHFIYFYLGQVAILLFKSG
uniref:Dynein light chain n=1 Tax=Cyprinus carpio carpio TaxID=630221 RepID=A0A9J8ANL7_CYPCA